MRLFVLRDDTLPRERLLGYLIYYETAKAFYMELSDGIDPWEAPPLFSAFAERGAYSINSYWSMRWVQQRIIPQDRQNLGQILRDNHLQEYDEFSLLLLARGRCEQDDFYLEEIPANPLPELLSRRWHTKLTDVVPLERPRLLVFFRNGPAKIVNAEELDNSACAPFLANQGRFDTVELQPDGYGIAWSERAAVSDQALYANSEHINLSLDDFIGFVQHRVVSASEACQILGGSRQNIDDLMKRGKLHPIRRDSKYKLFLRSEVAQRRQQTTGQ